MARLKVEAAGERQDLSVAPAERAAPLSELLARRGLPLNTRCGGRGLCAGCEVDLESGSLDGPQGAVAAPARVRSCQHRVDGDVRLAVPARSLLRHAPAVVDEFRLSVPWAQDPIESTARFGAAVDVGTTTVALLLADLATGAVAARASAFNAQIRYGEDVVTRIQLCATAPDAVGRLQRAVAGTIQELLVSAVAAAGIGLRDVGVMTVAGNTTMQHLLAGVDPSPLGTYPFRPVFLGERRVAPAELGLDFGGADARVHLLPGPGAYVGADLAAGVVATGMLYATEPTVLVDVGTNGEIIARAGDRLVGCATAAGPAFEGAGLASGTRAVSGAIAHVRLHPDAPWVETDVIGGGGALGVCGSAYVDLLGEGRRVGLLGPAGRFEPAFVARAGGRIVPDEFGLRLRLTAGGAGGPVWFAETDVARLLQAKAAIAAGIDTLLRRLGLRATDVRTVHLAGGFGLHLSVPHAIGCGLLPGFRPEQVSVCGNTALGGAFLALNDRSLLAETAAAARAVEVVELNLEPGFEDAYVEHLALP